MRPPPTLVLFALLLPGPPPRGVETVFLSYRCLIRCGAPCTVRLAGGGPGADGKAEFYLPPYKVGRMGPRTVQPLSREGAQVPAGLIEFVLVNVQKPVLRFEGPGGEVSEARFNEKGDELQFSVNGLGLMQTFHEVRWSRSRD